MTEALSRFTDLLDRHGPDFDRWPEAERPGARRLTLADPAARRAVEEARRLDALLAAHGARIDAGADPLAPGRIAAAVLSGLPARVPEVRWWLPRIAACVMLAVVAGGAFDVYVRDAQTVESTELAALDGLVFGPAELDLP